MSTRARVYVHDMGRWVCYGCIIWVNNMGV